MAKQLSTPTIHLRIDLGPIDAIGPGKIALLEHIDTSGSLSQAARELGMSYRRAWLLLKSINDSFAEPAVSASVGGAGGGGAQVTAFGKSLIEAYRSIEQDAAKAARSRLAWLGSQQNQRAGRPPVPRRSHSKASKSRAAGRA